jgi:ribosomal protein S27AE
VTEKIICGKCSFLLYWGEAIAERLYMSLSEEKVLEKYGNKCPDCGSNLSMNSVRIEIRDR